MPVEKLQGNKRRLYLRGWVGEKLEEGKEEEERDRSMCHKKIT